MKRTISGFTIVELLIVIVVIAILATISVVAYQGIQKRATTTVRVNEALSWKKAFELYRAGEGSWPSSMTPGDIYCLGEGFPIGAGGVARCYMYNNSTYGALQSASATLMSQLQKYAQVPSSAKQPVGGFMVGPHATVNSITGALEITQYYPADSIDPNCPRQGIMGDIVMCFYDIAP